MEIFHAAAHRPGSSSLQRLSRQGRLIITDYRIQRIHTEYKIQNKEYRIQTRRTGNPCWSHVSGRVGSNGIVGNFFGGRGVNWQVLAGVCGRATPERQSPVLTSDLVRSEQLQHRAGPGVDKTTRAPIGRHLHGTRRVCSRTRRNERTPHHDDSHEHHDHHYDHTDAMKQRRLLRFHGLKRPVSSPSPASAHPSPETDLPPSAAHPPNLEQVQPLQPRPPANPQHRRKDLLPTEMDRQGPRPRLPRRAHQGGPVGAHVQPPHPVRRRHEPRLHGPLQRQRAGRRPRLRPPPGSQLGLQAAHKQRVVRRRRRPQSHPLHADDLCPHGASP